MEQKYSDEVIYCVKYLDENGITSKTYDDVLLYTSDLKDNFHIVKTENKDFYIQLARGLRDLWPTGEKGGKYPWRDTLDNLRRRLMHLWAIRFKTKSYTIDECLVCARRYLSQFEEDKKYMKILKYFILKQRREVDEVGKVTFINESVLADMLDAGMGTIIDGDIDVSDEVLSIEEGMLI